MAEAQATAAQRRTKLPGAGNHNLWYRTLANGRTVYEIGWKDRERKRHFKTAEMIGGQHAGLQQARAERDKILGKLAGGAQVQANPRLTYGQAADAWLATL